MSRTLLYTAVTRAQRQVILAGDEAAARAAVMRLPRAQARGVALDKILKAALEAAPAQSAVL
jgi:exodeoxyribonuclease V alpha subunit